MGIFSRLTDIINSNINALLDKAEDPQKMLRLIINEMEETLVEVRSSAAKILADKKTLLRKVDLLKMEASDWASKAKLALTKNREELAKGALLEKQAVTEQVVLMESELQELDIHLSSLSEEVDLLQNKINDAKARQKTMLLRAKTAENRLKDKKQAHKDNMQRAFERLEGVERTIDHLEGELDSFDLSGERFKNSVFTIGK
jgi:phage shock protein A